MWKFGSNFAGDAKLPTWKGQSGTSIDKRKVDKEEYDSKKNRMKEFSHAFLVQIPSIISILEYCMILDLGIIETPKLKNACRYPTYIHPYTSQVIVK